MKKNENRVTIPGDEIKFWENLDDFWTVLRCEQKFDFKRDIYKADWTVPIDYYEKYKEEALRHRNL